jgi:hypothetical protein
VVDVNSILDMPYYLFEMMIIQKVKKVEKERKQLEEIRKKSTVRKS